MNNIPPGNPRQGNLGQVDWGRPTQQDKINLTKNLTDYALTKAQEVATPVIEQAIANKYPNTPRPAIQATVGFSLTQAKNQTQRVVTTVLESDCCYGNEDSSISRLVERKFK